MIPPHATHEGAGVYDGSAEEAYMSRTRTEPSQPSALPVPETASDRPERRAGEAHGLSLIAAVEARLALSSPPARPVTRDFHLSAALKDARIGTRGPSQEVDP